MKKGKYIIKILSHQINPHTFEPERVWIYHGHFRFKRPAENYARNINRRKSPPPHNVAYIEKLPHARR